MMVQHVVMWKLREGQDKAEIAAHISGMFAEFQHTVPGLLKLEVNPGYQGYDVCLLSEHADRAALDAYQVHPGHLEVKKYVHSVIAERASCDFERE